MTPDDLQLLLSKALEAESVEVFDKSDQHRGHVGNLQGGGHYYVRIVSDRFEGLNKIERHRLVYDALAEKMKDEIHALGIQAFTKREAEGVKK